ncbi:MAG: High molecular weight rubredoxin [Kiritimatiellaeota bacterium]|nr:High molecular weight rubredoxin [Kiritimatiellota bacterium]
MPIAKKALFKISYGLYVVSSATPEENSGFIGNTVVQVTSKPPRVAIGVSRDNHTHGVIVDSGKLAVSVLSRGGNPALIQTFGYKTSRETDKFADVSWCRGENGVPVVDEGVLAFFECSVSRRIELDTHDLFICEITVSEILNDRESPLTYEYYREVLKGKAPKNAPTFIDESQTSLEGGAVSSGASVCSVCRYEYDPEKGDPEHGIAPGTSFDDLPNDWTCPICSSPKEVFA